MKTKKWTLLSMIALMASCTDEVEQIYEEQLTTSPQLSRSCYSDTLNLGELVCFEPTEEQMRLQELAPWLKKRTRAYTEDPYFSNNIYAIREMPVTIKVRSVASGSSSSMSYLYCLGAGQEVKLGNTEITPEKRFYIKVCPPSSGIPYLIYSMQAQTPLTVGQYTNDPNNKIVMASKDNSLSSLCAWDLLPSSSYKGYFAIENTMYLGQDGSSIFSHVIEAKAGDRLGYAKRDNWKGQQDFLITTIDSFKISTIEYDLQNATLTDGEPIVAPNSLVNIEDYAIKQYIVASKPKTDTSSFYEKSGDLNLNLFSKPDSLFFRPEPIAGRVTILDGAKPKIPYTTTTYEMSDTIKWKGEIEMKPRCLLELTTKFKTYHLRVPFVATAVYMKGNEAREVKFEGTWNGFTAADPNYNRPIQEAHFYSLDTGEELNYTLVFDEPRNRYLVK